jgi:hypothetical protein
VGGAIVVGASTKVLAVTKPRLAEDTVNVYELALATANEQPANDATPPLTLLGVVSQEKSPPLAATPTAVVESDATTFPYASSTATTIGNCCPGVADAGG